MRFSSIKAAAIGIEPLEHTYIGIPTINIITIDAQTEPRYFSIKEAGTKYEMQPATIIPNNKKLTAIFILLQVICFILCLNINIANNESNDENINNAGIPLYSIPPVLKKSNR